MLGGVKLITPDGRYPHGVSENSPEWEAIAFSPDREMVISRFPNGLYEVHDPLVASAYNVGDGSFFETPVADAYVKAMMDYYGLHFSTRHLINPEEREKKPGTGRWSTMQHSIGVSAVSQLIRCSPTEIMYAATHDAAKRNGGHRSDDVLEGRGKEDAHDRARLSFLERSGFLDYLRTKNIIDRHGIVESIGVPVSSVIDPPPGRSVINMPSSMGELEPERIQYPLYERNIWIDTDPSAVQEVVQSFSVRTLPDGDRIIVCNNEDAAYILWESVIRCHSELWGEPGDAIINELLMAQTRFMMTHVDGATTDLRKYAVGDSLYIPEEAWIKRSRSMETEVGQRFNSAVDKVIAKLVEHQREVHAQYDSHSNVYSGPIMPDWVTLARDNSYSFGSGQHTRYSRSTNALEIEIVPGKQRYVNPYVDDSRTGRKGGIEHIREELKGVRTRRYRWSAQPFSVSIDLNHPDLDIHPSEKAALEKGLRIASDNWAKAMVRPEMPREILTERIQNWGKRTLELSASAARSAGL